MAHKESQRVLPTLGLRLGLMMTFMVIGVAPLIKVYVAFRLNAGQDDIIWRVPFDTWTILVGFSCLSLLLVTFMAWRAWPPGIRVIFQGVLITTMVLIIIETIVRLDDEACANCVVSIREDVINDVFRCLLPIQILTFFYMIWYINRAPARAFYRREVYDESNH